MNEVAVYGGDVRFGGLRELCWCLRVMCALSVGVKLFVDVSTCGHTLGVGLNRLRVHVLSTPKPLQKPCARCFRLRTPLFVHRPRLPSSCSDGYVVAPCNGVARVLHPLSPSPRRSAPQKVFAPGH
jgi:hypothetical protein